MAYNNYSDTHELSVQETANLKTKCTYKLYTITPTIQTAEYEAGDVLFATTEIADFFPNVNHAGRIESVLIFDAGSESPPITLYLTTDSRDFGTINAGANAADAIIDGVQAIIPFVANDFIGGNDYTDNCSIANISRAYTGQTARNGGGIGSIVQATGSSTSLYIAGIINGTETFDSTSSLIIKIGVSFF